MLAVLKKLLTLKKNCHCERSEAISHRQSDCHVATAPRNDKVILTILAAEFSVFAAQTKQAAEFGDYVQIDVMDGEFVDNISFPEREEINLLASPLKWELHLMVKHPLQELDKWKPVKNVFRAIFHIESADEPAAVIEKIKNMGYSAGMAISPDTPLEKITPFLNRVDMVLFMTVVPGRQGSPFRSDVGEKIKKFKTEISRFARNDNEWPTIAVDGAVNENTIAQIKSWGVEIFNVGSALTHAPDMKAAYEKLKKYV